MATDVLLRGVRISHRVGFSGHGLLAGMAPVDADPESPDGRFKRLNVPSRGRVVAFERSTMRPIAMTRSADDGTWLITGLNPDTIFTVVGFDDEGLVNAAIQDWITAHLPEP